MASGGGGLPGTATSTGSRSAGPVPQAKLGEHPSRQRAGPDGDDPFGRRHGVVGLFQGQPHVVGQRPHDQHHVRLPGRRCDEEPQAVHVVVGIIQLFDFVQAGPAVSRIHDQDVDGTPERGLRVRHWLAGPR